MISNNRFWKIIENSDWANLSKQKEIDFNLEKKKNSSLYNDCFYIHQAIQYYTSILQQRVRHYFQSHKNDMEFYENKYKMYLSDDTFWYLCNHIVGIGEDEYFKCMNNPVRIFKHKNFKEGFEYLF